MNPWLSFVKDCELFTQAPSCVQSGITGCAKPVSTSPWWLHILGQLWRTSSYEYGTGVVPNKGEGWRSYAAEGEVTSRPSQRRCSYNSLGASVASYLLLQP